MQEEPVHQADIPSLQDFVELREILDLMSFGSFPGRDEPLRQLGRPPRLRDRSGVFPMKGRRESR
jgi:hypothetical protein